jgi:CO/xanthine dehydrogenase FAD-binding subunit
MSDLNYQRPKTLQEALKLLEQGIPLAGGTALVPDLKGAQTVIDLQDLGLDGIKKTKKSIQAGAAVKLQALIESGTEIPAALAAACQLEANLNLRNMATLGGTIMSGDSRSPLVTALLALDVEAQLEPSAEKLSLDHLLDRRSDEGFQSLITSMRIPLDWRLAYDQVARAPNDRPIVCVALGYPEGKGLAKHARIVLGGFGLRPQRVPQAEQALSEGRGIDAAAAAAREAYGKTDDHWASGEYRSHVAGILVGRLLAEVMG